jgi:hypothetical protein
MQYAYGYQLNGSQAGGLDPSAKAYINTVVAAGATVSGAQRTAINNFVKTGKTDGWYSSLSRIYLPIWGVAAPNAICMTSLTSGTFNGGVTHASGYVNSNGATGYFLLDQAPASLGLTTSSANAFVLVTGTAAIAGNSELGRVQDSSNNSRFGFTSGGTNVRGVRLFTASSLTYAETDSRSILVISRTTTTTNSSYKRTSSGFVTTVNEGSATSPVVGTVQPMVYMASNNNGVVSGFSQSSLRFGSYGMGLGMTPTQAENFSAGLKTLWETCTGLALP